MVLGLTYAFFETPKLKRGNAPIERYLFEGNFKESDNFVFHQQFIQR